MKNHSRKIDGYDLIRTSMILIVFIEHILQTEGSDSVKIIALCFNPGLTMSLLGFISGALLGSNESDTGTFLIRRLMRIYLSLIPCLCLVLLIHLFIGKIPIESLFQQGERLFIRHIIIHLMGLSAFFQVFVVTNSSTIGGGLWFITVIVALYFVLPILQKLFRHHHGFIHLLVVTTICIAFQLVGLGVSSASNVIISFSLGVYLVTNNKLEYLTQGGSPRHLFFSGVLLVTVAMTRTGLIPAPVQSFLYIFYPLAFVPLFFSISTRLPAPILAASGFFAGLSYEFYILHFYFIGNNFRDFFPASIPLYAHIVISFIISLMLAFVMSKCVFGLNRTMVMYFFEYVKNSESRVKE